MTLIYPFLQRSFSRRPSPAVHIIQESRAGGVAPCGIFYDVGNLSGREYWDLLYVWTFDDVGDYTNIASDIPWGRSKNIAYGPMAGHTFDTNGTYTVTLKIYDSTGLIETITTTATITDPDTVYAGTKTVVVALDSNFAGKPTNATERSTWDAGVDAIKALSGGDGRLLLKRGETHTLTARENFKDEYNNVYIGAWSTGNDPIIKDYPIEMNSAFTGDATISNINFVGNWDSTIETGNGHDGLRFRNSNGNNTAHSIVCQNLGIGITVADTGSGTTVLSNLSSTGWKGYGIQVPDCHKIAFCGVSVRQNVDARGGGKGKGTGFNEHGPVRISRPSYGAAFNLTDWLSITGWTQVGGNPAHQPCIRWNAGGGQDRRINLDRVRAEGGSKILSLLASSGGTQDFPNFVLVDKAYLVGTANTGSAVLCSFGGTTIRNTVMVVPDIVAPEGNGPSWFIGEDVDTDNQVNFDRPMEFYSNTFIDLRQGAVTLSEVDLVHFATTFNINNGWTDVTSVNNVGHAPDHNTPVTTESPLVTVSLFTPSYKGLKWEDAQTLDTAYANAASDIWSANPNTGSAAINGWVSGKVALDDFYGTLRDGTPNIGAFENVG